MNFDALIFDLDGTLFQTDKLVLPAFENTFIQLEKHGYLMGDRPSNEDLLSVLGFTLDEIWEKLLPGLPFEAHELASKYMLLNELDGVKNGYGALYSNVVETLIDLENRGVKLYIASNGQKEYVEGIANEFRIDHFFDGMYTAGEYKTKSKSDLVKRLILDHSIKNGVMIGDRSSDVEAGKNNKLFVIGCDFGFGNQDELREANLIITDFKEILDLLMKEQ